MKVILNVDNIEELKVLITEFNEGKRRLPYWEFQSFSPGVLIAIEKLGKDK
jgi:hypothetical protein